MVRDNNPTWDCGYAFSIQLRDGGIFTVYYFVDEAGTRFVAGTHWNFE